jgi:polyphosphate glucokinase
MIDHVECGHFEAVGDHVPDDIAPQETGSAGYKNTHKPLSESRDHRLLGSPAVGNTSIGVDVGGSGVKAGLVDVDAGRLVSERLRIETPEPATPDAVAAAVAQVVAELGEDGDIGLGFPAVVKAGVAYTANNIDQGWIGTDVVEVIGHALGRRVVISNDADAAGLAEARYGAARGVRGTVLVVTFGTGIGSALVYDGVLVPNLELGMLELEGIRPAELRFSAKARRREDLDWDVWGDRASEFLAYVDSVFSPELIVFGGGVSKHWDLFSGRIDDRLPVTPALLGNDAGIVGAALLVAESSPSG